MRNTLVIDMSKNSLVTCMDNVGEDENTIYFLLYPINTGNTVMNIYDDAEKETLLYSQTFTGEDFYYIQFPVTIYPTSFKTLFVSFVGSGYESDLFEFDFRLRSAEAYERQMVVQQKFDNNFRYSVVFREVMSNEEIVQQLENTEAAVAANAQQIQNVSETVAQSTTLNESLIESLTTNLTKYALKPRVTHKTDGWEWTDFVTNPDSSVTYTPCFSSTSHDKVRNYINIEDVKIKYLTEILVVPASYSQIAEAETDYLIINGKQIYYTDLSTLNAFTTISPKNFDKTITPHVEDMYKCRKLKAESEASWNINIYSTITTETIEDATVVNKSVGIELDTVANINYDSTTKTLKTTITSENDNKQYGFSVTDTENGTNCYVINAGNSFMLRPEKVYNTLAEAEADTILPTDGKALIAAGG